MKKVLAAVLGVVFISAAAFAQEAFLSLTKYSESTEKLPTNITIITQEDIEDRHVETLGELLRHETSINFKSYGTIGAATSISIRGASSLQTLVLIDGRRVNDMGLGSADFTSISTENIERVEIIRGAGASIYGTSAFGGVVNVITKKATMDSPVLDTSFSYGSFNTLRAGMTGAYATETVSALVTTSMMSTDGERDNSAFNNHNILFNAGTNLTSNSVLSLSANMYESVFGAPGSLTYPSNDSEQKDSNKYVKAGYKINYGKSDLNVTAYTSQNKRKYIDPAYMTKDRYTNESYGFQADYVWNKILLVGAEWWQEDYKKEDLITDSRLTDKERKNTAVYAQLNFNLGKLTLIPSVRGDSNSAYGEVLTPALSAVFNFNERFKLSANGGKVWRAPTFSELFDDYPAWFTFGNPDLEPEKGISGDVGAEYSHGKVRFAVTGFYIETDNLIKFVGTTYENIDETRQYGVELEAGYVMTSWLSHKLNYTYTKAENRKTDRVLDYSPENIINYSMTIKPFQGLSISPILSFRDPQKVTRFGRPTPETIAGFTTLDLNVNYNINENISCWLKGFNITNSDYQIIDDYPMPGATVFAGINLKFWK